MHIINIIRVAFLILLNYYIHIIKTTEKSEKEKYIQI